MAAQNGPAYLEDYQFNIILEKMPPRDIVYFDSVEMYGLMSVNLHFMHNPRNHRLTSYSLEFVRNQTYDDKVDIAGGFYLNVVEGRGKSGWGKIECNKYERKISFPAPNLNTSISFCAAPVMMNNKKTKYYRFNQSAFGSEKYSSINVGSTGIDPREFKNAVSKLRYHVP